MDTVRFGDLKAGDVFGGATPFGHWTGYAFVKISRTKARLLRGDDKCKWFEVIVPASKELVPLDVTFTPRAP